MKTFYVVDESGSVTNQDLYFDKVMQLFCGNFFEERGDIFYIWNQDYKKLSLYEIQNFINEKDGDKRTNSSLIAEIVNIEKNNKFEHLIIITDGDVKKEELDKSDKLIKEYDLHFSFVRLLLLILEILKQNLFVVPIREIVLDLLILLIFKEIKEK